ncbi:hypothetical protein BV25DRAFT_1165479 [Artomyces pyxidatus]|uniref:Uncharacterized protein n=1 Tax=Artomyces pyxidatus TaxID=48021 RepID=A0ACB8ST28_9AGAM|nr:hypothetical protein BV25DRAFT_1165479 [Artomyces pyxidatus]
MNGERASAITYCEGVRPGRHVLATGDERATGDDARRDRRMPDRTYVGSAQRGNVTDGSEQGGLGSLELWDEKHVPWHNTQLVRAIPFRQARPAPASGSHSLLCCRPLPISIQPHHPFLQRSPLAFTMAAVLQPNRFTPYRSPPTAGILLNPSPSHSAVALPASPFSAISNLPPASPYPSSSSSSHSPPSSTDTTPPPSLQNSLTLPPPFPQSAAAHNSSRGRSSSSPAAGRRIRFAPLPDPRRAVCVTEHGIELPLPAVFDSDDDELGSTSCAGAGSSSTSSSDHPTPSLLLGDAVLNDPRAVPTITTTSPPNTPPSPPSPTAAPTKRAPSPHRSTPPQSNSRLAKKLFKPFLFKPASASSSDLHSAPSSRESSRTRGDDAAWGAPLGRWTSESSMSTVTSRRTVTTAPTGTSSSSNTKSSSGTGWSWGAPLGRAQSASASSAPKRMLNGRVYGAPRRQQQQPFANVRDEEPEFVEWGYGGMGAVKKGTSGASSAWSRLQSDQKVVVGAFDDAPRGRRVERDEDDDGSGMAWVKKRREAKERREREEREKEKAVVKHVEDTAVEAQETEDKGEQEHVPAHVLLALPPPTAHHPHTDEKTAALPAAPKQEQESASSTSSSSDDEEEADDEGVKEEADDDDDDEEEVRCALDCCRGGKADGLCRTSIARRRWARAWSSSAGIANELHASHRALPLCL